jgi:hypothetical protein
MAESKSAIGFGGWQGATALVIALSIAGFRIMTMGDSMGDTALIQQLELQLMTEYFPNDVNELRSIYASGDKEAIAKAVKSITSSKFAIKSVHTSFPLFKYSTNQRVFVKVTYALDDASGHRTQDTKYFRFRYGGLLGSRWTYLYEAGPISYYLNFF